MMLQLKEQLISALDDNFVSNITVSTSDTQFSQFKQSIDVELIDNVFYLDKKGQSPNYHIETYFKIKRKYYLLNLQFFHGKHLATAIVGKNLNEIVQVLKSLEEKNYFTDHKEAMLIKLEKHQLEQDVKNNQKMINQVKTKMKI